MHQSSWSRWLGVLACALFFAAQAMAQLSSTTSLVGTITDASGAIVPGVSITAVNVAMRDTYHAVSNSDGDYSFPFVHIGTYTITASAKGFQTATHTGIIVETNQTVRTDFTLQVGQVSQTVTVTGGAPPIKTDDASVSQIINHEQIADLPLNGRDPLELAITTPGVIAGLKGVNGVPPGEDFIGAGAREIQNEVTLDGVSIMNNLITTTNFRPSLAAMQEFQVQTGTYSAQYGGYMGVHMNLVTKSGTNQLHGSVFEFLRNDAFDARTFFEKSSQPKIPFHRNQFGGELGGPLVIPKVYNGKNKTFFMVDYEGLRQLQSTGALATVLTPKMRTGDFSELSTAIHDPLLPGDPNLSGNVIPTGDIAPAALKLLQFMPAPNQPGLTNNYVASVVTNDSWDQTVDRVDQNIGEKTRLFFRYAYITDVPVNGATNPTGGQKSPNNDTNFVVGYTQTIKPTMVNDFRIGRQSLTTNSVNYFYGDSALDALAQTVNIPGFAYSSANPGTPLIATTGYMTIGNGATNWFQTDETWEVNDQFSVMHGPHSIIAGFDLSKFRTGRSAVNEPQGQLNFTGQLSGFAPADLMLGLPASDFTPAPEIPGLVAQWRDGFFALDKWDATRKLTLNIGVRYELPTAPYTINGNATILNATNTALIPPSPPKPGFVFVQPERTDVGPRLGLAYRLTDKWVLRGGFGIYYNPNQMNSWTFLNTNPPFSPVFDYQNNPPFANPVVTLANPAPASALKGQTPTPNVITPGLPFFSGRMNQWSFDVERTLWQNAGLDVQYLGNYAYHLDTSFHNNTPLPGPGAIQARRPNQLWGDIRTISNNEYSHYNALNMILTQRMSHGATLLVSYTYSHSLDEGTDSNGGGQPMDPYDWALDYGNSNWDIRHRLVADYVYALPFFSASQNVFERDVLGGWQLNGITTLQDGLPFNVVMAGDIANNGVTGVQRPNLIAHPYTTCGSGNLTNCITAGAFAVPALYTFGTAGRNILFGPGRVNFDFSLFKNIPIGERSHFQFRAEFFNLFNTPQFSNPNATFGAASFGTVTSTTSNNRQIQFALQYIF
ncbi:MAG: TonB-dependent receptor domain-containing protein [Terriglobia bacterium]